MLLTIPRNTYLDVSNGVVLLARPCSRALAYLNSLKVSDCEKGRFAYSTVEILLARASIARVRWEAVLSGAEDIRAPRLMTYRKLSDLVSLPALCSSLAYVSEFSELIC